MSLELFVKSIAFYMDDDSKATGLISALKESLFGLNFFLACDATLKESGDWIIQIQGQ